MEQNLPERSQGRLDFVDSPFVRLDETIRQGTQNLVEILSDKGIPFDHLEEISLIVQKLNTFEEVELTAVKRFADSYETPGYKKSAERAFASAREDISSNRTLFFNTEGEVEKQKIASDHQRGYLVLNSSLQSSYLSTFDIQDLPIEDELLHQAGVVVGYAEVIFDSIHDITHGIPKRTSWGRIFRKMTGQSQESSQVPQELKDQFEKLWGLVKFLHDDPNKLFGNIIGFVRQTEKSRIRDDIQSFIANANESLKQDMASQPAGKTKKVKTLGRVAAQPKLDARSIESVTRTSSVASEKTRLTLVETSPPKKDEKREKLETVRLSLPWIKNGEPEEHELHITQTDNMSVGYVRALIEKTDKIATRARKKTEKASGASWFDDYIKRTVELLLSGADPNSGQAVFKGRMHTKFRVFKDEFSGIPIFYDGSSGKYPSRIYVAYCDTRNSKYLSDKVDPSTELPDIILFILAETDKHGQVDVLRRLSGSNRAAVVAGAKAGSK